MSDDSKHQLVDAGSDSAGSERAAAASPLKTWVTPKVITSVTSEDTAVSAGNASDGSNHSGNFS
jgi:hypothetical protein